MQNFIEIALAPLLVGMSMVWFGSVWTKNSTITILIRFLKLKTKTKPYINGSVQFLKFGFDFKCCGFGLKTNFIKYFLIYLFS